MKSKQNQEQEIVLSAEEDKNETINEGFSNYETVTENKDVPFWTENPNVLFNGKYVLELFPVEEMSYNQKLNAVSRTVIFLTIIGFLFSRNLRTLVVGLVTLGSVFLLHHYHMKEKNKENNRKLLSDNLKEGFENPIDKFITNENEELAEGVFDEPNPNNPFSNVMMTDYNENPDKKPAPPAFNQTTNESILENAKKLVVEANPDQPDIADKLFKDLGEQYTFEQSLRPFHSNPSTTVPNDQKAFSEFCYGSMVSCKEGNPFACSRNMPRYNHY